VAEQEPLVTGQLAFDGVVAEQEPLHWMVPEVVWPQTFGALVQAAPWFTTQPETQEEPFQMRGAVQVLQVGGLLAPLAQEFGTQAVPFQVWVESIIRLSEALAVPQLRETTQGDDVGQEPKGMPLTL
jgi:hypothetical protein